MAHKITQLFKKKPTFPQTDSDTGIRELVLDIKKRLDTVEATLEELVKQGK